MRDDVADCILHPSSFILHPSMEAPTGFEPVIRVLQTRALPLGYGAQKSAECRVLRTECDHASLPLSTRDSALSTREGAEDEI